MRLASIQAALNHLLLRQHHRSHLATQNTQLALEYIKDETGVGRHGLGHTADKRTMMLEYFLKREHVF